MFSYKCLILLGLLVSAIHSFTIELKLTKLFVIQAKHNCKMLHMFGIESLEPELEIYMQFCPNDLLKFIVQNSKSRLASLAASACFAELDLSSQKFCESFVAQKMQKVQESICQTPTNDPALLTAGFYDDCQYETKSLNNLIDEYCDLEDKRQQLARKAQQTQTEIKQDSDELNPQPFTESQTSIEVKSTSRRCESFRLDERKIKNKS